MSDVEANVLPPYRSKVDLVYEYLRARILSRELRAEEPLNIDRLARQLGVSKIPVREALRSLESQGFVVQTAHIGAMVAPLDLRELHAVSKARQTMERLVAEEAASNITAEQLECLERSQLSMRTCWLDGNIDGMANANLEFHVVIADATSSRVLRDITRQILIYVSRYRAAAPLSSDDWREALAEHESIIAALRKHDVQAAGERSWNHARLRPERDPIDGD